MITILRTTIDEAQAEKGFPIDEDLDLELAVIDMIGRRIFLKGYPNYGPMETNMNKDFEEEALEELLDSIIYMTMALLKIKLKRYNDYYCPAQTTDCSCGCDQQEQLQQGENHCFDPEPFNGRTLSVGE